jgi:hypothetical protein
VYDVSNKKEMYGPGAGYNVFAGKDASKGLGEFDEVSGRCHRTSSMAFPALRCFLISAIASQLLLASLAQSLAVVGARTTGPVPEAEVRGRGSVYQANGEPVRMLVC